MKNQQIKLIGYEQSKFRKNSRNLLIDESLNSFLGILVGVKDFCFWADSSKFKKSKVH